jgi:hypothetical protein
MPQQQSNADEVLIQSHSSNRAADLSYELRNDLSVQVVLGQEIGGARVITLNRQRQLNGINNRVVGSFPCLPFSWASLLRLIQRRACEMFSECPSLFLRKHLRLFVPGFLL